ncbi:hypothetical protein CF319_g5217 [Tilletia indica]|nr:hypothetical protein CF319_g5217 [Tilletia indica]
MSAVPTEPLDLQHTLAAMTPDQFDQYQEVRQQLLVLYMTTISATVIILWEHVLLWGAEMRTWRALLQGKIMPARLAVVLVRYLVIAAIGITLVFLFGSPPNCKSAIVTIYSLYTALVAVASSIFLMRLHIIFAGHPYIMACYYLMFVANIVAWIVIDLGMEAYEIPANLRWKHGGQCAPHAVPWYGSIAWGCNLLFDAMTLLGTWWKLHSMQNKKGKKSMSNRTHRFIWLSNIFYFSVSCAFNIACLVTELTVTSPIYSHLPSPIAFCAHTIISSRLLLTAKGWGALDPEEDLEDAATPNMNTFHLTKRRNGSGGLQHKNMPPVSFTVDEVVTIHEAPENEAAHSTAINGRRPGSPMQPSAMSDFPSTGSCSKLDSGMSGSQSGSQHSRFYVDSEPVRIGQIDREMSSSPMRGTLWTKGLGAPPPQNVKRSSSSESRHKTNLGDDPVPIEPSARAAYPRLSGVIVPPSHGFASGNGPVWNDIPEGGIPSSQIDSDYPRAPASSAAPSSAMLSSSLSKGSTSSMAPSHAFPGRSMRDLNPSSSPGRKDSSALLGLPHDDRMVGAGHTCGGTVGESEIRQGQGHRMSASTSSSKQQQGVSNDLHHNQLHIDISKHWSDNETAISPTPPRPSTDCVSVQLRRASTFGRRSPEGSTDAHGETIESRKSVALRNSRSAFGRESADRAGTEGSAGSFGTSTPSLGIGLSRAGQLSHPTFEAYLAGINHTPARRQEDLGGGLRHTERSPGAMGQGGERREISAPFNLMEHGASGTYEDARNVDSQSIAESVILSSSGHRHDP